MICRQDLPEMRTAAVKCQQLPNAQFACVREGKNSEKAHACGGTDIFKAYNTLLNAYAACGALDSIDEARASASLPSYCVRPARVVETDSRNEASKMQRLCNFLRDRF